MKIQGADFDQNELNDRSATLFQPNTRQCEQDLQLWPMYNGKEELDLMILRAFSNLKDSIILWSQKEISVTNTNVKVIHR